jgi:hypothetical protein
LIPDNHVICQTGKPHALNRVAHAFLVGDHGECHGLAFAPSSVECPQPAKPIREGQRSKARFFRFIQNATDPSAMIGVAL